MMEKPRKVTMQEIADRIGGLVEEGLDGGRGLMGHG